MSARFEPNVVREMSVVLFASIVLGLAYNHSSPLGISFSESAPVSTSSLAGKKAAPMDPLPPGESDPSIHNDTITALIVSGGPDNAGPPGRQLRATLPWGQVKPLLAKGEVVLVDGRETAAYEAGHIPGAISLPLQTLADKIVSFTTRYPKNKPLVMYCASITCPISQAEAALLAEKYGYSDVREMPGGFAEWRVAEPGAAPATGANP
jgi:rhodanese-related sulfurtransferase